MEFLKESDCLGRGGWGYVTSITTAPSRHKPLLENQIRLVKILPGVQNADVSCSVVHVPVERTPKYRALSYVWGPPQPSRTISCNGALLNVRDNLYRALKYLSKQPAQYYWIDALCINQEDTEEKGKQVQCIGKIYSGAQEVLIWLGEDTPEPSQDLQFVVKTISPDHGSDWRQEVFINKYWSRLWTCQEAMLSGEKVVLHKGTEMDWSTLIRSCPLEPQYQQALRFSSLVSSVDTLQRLLKDPTIADQDADLLLLAWKEFQQLTTFAKSLQTTDPRDQIFSWFGIAGILGIKLPAPDYTKPVAVVFKEARHALIEKYRDLPDDRKPTATRTAGMKVHATLPIRTGAGAMKTPSAPHHTPELSRIQSRCNESSGSEESTDPEDDAELEDPWRTALKHLVSENKVLLLGTLLADVTFGRPEDSSFVCCGNSKDAAHTGARHQKESQNQSNKKQRTNAKDSKGTGDRKGHHDQGHDSDDDDMHDRSRKLVKKLGQGEPQNRFACPFFQRDSQCPWLNSSCHGPGFPTIHRLKEHLDRVHYIYQCDRCGEIFDTQPLLAAHRLVPALQICDVIDWAANFDRNNGFADTQKASIKQIKPNKSENPWHEIYGVLFPEDVESSYPPPYHNDTQFTQFLHRLQSHWTQHAPVVISQRLPNAGFLSRLATQEPQVIRAELVQLVNQIGMDIIRPFQHEIFRDRQDIEQGQRPVLPGCEHSHGFPTVARAMHGSATSEAQAGPSMDALALPSDYSTLNDNPPHPARALLDLFNDLAPTFNDDTSWALNLPFDDAVAGPSTIGVPHETRDSSNINPQQLALGPQQRTVFDGDRDDVVQSVEGDWDFVTG